MIDIFTSENMENMSLCISQYLTLYYIINFIISAVSIHNPLQWVMHQSAILISDGVKVQMRVLDVRFTRQIHLLGGGSEGMLPRKIFEDLCLCMSSTLTHRRTGFISIGGAVVYIARKYLGAFLDFSFGDVTPPPEFNELRLK